MGQNGMGGLDFWGGSSHDALDEASPVGPSEPVHLREARTRAESPPSCPVPPDHCPAPAVTKGMVRAGRRAAWPSSPLRALAPLEPRGAAVS